MKSPIKHTYLVYGRGKDSLARAYEALGRELPRLPLKDGNFDASKSDGYLVTYGGEQHDWEFVSDLTLVQEESLHRIKGVTASRTSG